MTSGHYSVAVLADDAWVHISDNAIRQDADPFSRLPEDIVLVVLRRG
jgi:hypothetical protein